MAARRCRFETRGLGRGIGVVLALVLLSAIPGAAQSWQDEVNEAIDRGVEHLLKRQKPDGNIPIADPYENMDERYKGGGTALGLYALLKSGVPPTDPAVRRAVEAMRYTPFEKVYTVGATILALDALGSRDEDAFIKKAAEWLEDHIHPKAKVWGYPDGGPELSNSQYGAMGLYFAQKRHGFKARPETWAGFIEGTLRFQNPDGGFYYRTDSKPESYGSMTVAGIACLWFAQKSLEGDQRFASARKAAEEGLQRAWKYMDRVFTAAGDPGLKSGQILDVTPGNRTRYRYIHYYYLYGLERACSLADIKELGGRDWYQEGAIHLLGAQQDDGSWGVMCDTAFALLFLKRATLSSLDSATASAGVAEDEKWAFAFETPPTDWAAVSFDDSKWARGAGAFGGGGGAGGGIFRTEWKTKEIWLRRSFSTQEQKPEAFSFYILHDDDGEVFVNGVLAAKLPGYSEGGYKRYECSAEARSTIRQGPNTIALHVRNTGGAQSADLRLKDVGRRAERKGESADEARKRWWKARPRSDVPFVPQWLVLGPVADPDGMKFTASLLPDEDAEPTEGARWREFAWRRASARGGWVDLSAELKPVVNSLAYAFAHLEVKEDRQALLWIGADDGYRVLLDGKVLCSNYFTWSSAPDAQVVPIRLSAGKHRLLVKIWNGAPPSGFSLRLSSRDGTPLEGVLAYVGDPSEARTVLAKAAPDALPLGELLALLPNDVLDKLEFNDGRELDRAALGGGRPGFPRYVAAGAAGGASPQPPLGARGLVATTPVTPSRPSRIFRKTKVTPARLRVTATVAADARSPKPEEAGFRARIGVFAGEGEIRWLCEEVVKASAKSRPDDWKQLSADLSEFLEKEILVVLEIGHAGAPLKNDHAFIDEFSLRPAR